MLAVRRLLPFLISEKLFRRVVTDYFSVTGKNVSCSKQIFIDCTCTSVISLGIIPKTTVTIVIPITIVFIF